MKKKEFVHLHLHTCFSLLDGACRIDGLVDFAGNNDMPAVAMTDHGVMYGAIDFYKAANSGGIKPIIGCEMYVTSGSRFDRKSEGHKTQNYHLVLLAEDNIGYSNLVKLCSLAHLEGFYYKPRIDHELLSRHSKGLIGLSACLKGEVASALTENDVRSAEKIALEYAEILGKDNFFLEMQDHGLPAQKKIIPLIKDLSAKTGLPLVATNDVHYISKDHAEAHEVLLCLQTQTVMSDPKRLKYQTQEFFMKTRAEMERVFSDFPEALDITTEIAERCNVELEFGKPHFPTYNAPNGMPQKDYLVSLGMDGIKKKYGITDPLHPKNDEEKNVVNRFKDELKVIENTGFINYFLVVWDFVKFAHESKIPVGPGRGSGGGSLMAYVLDITAIDPLRYNLIFERFLNPERISPPDFDIDFCQNRRGEVIEYVKRKYGNKNVAQIITFGSLGAKSVIRDVGRVLEIPYGKCDSISRMVPEDPKMTLKLALDISQEFKKAYKNDADCKRILNYAMVLEGLYRNPGTHAAGVVISEMPLIDIVPLSRDKDGNPVTQYAMEPLGEIGLLKMDFLGLKTLTVIDETLRLLETKRGIKIDLENIPFDDGPTYDLFNRGDTIGVFQLESTGMRDLVRRVGINVIEDLIAMIALYRPGPMNMLDDYVKRKSKKAKINYDHPLLEDLLRETYGVMLYQEQVQKAANVLAGYSLGEADILRRAMGKKKRAEMEAQRSKFISGCAKTSKIQSRKAGQIFDTIAKFAGYGFNKAHSAGYAIIAYQTAYLKANYPVEFISSLLSSEIGNADKLPVFIVEAQKMGLEILPPDVNEGDVRFTPSGEKAVRFGLAGIKNVGEGAARAIVDERTNNGKFQSLTDFFTRVGTQSANRKVVESLIRCGAFDSIEPNRARLFNNLDFVISRSAEELKDKESGQSSLFEMLDDPSVGITEDLPNCDPWHESELLSAEKELLGIYLSGHPLTQYLPVLEKYQLNSVKTLTEMEDKAQTRIGGIISDVTKRITKTSKKMMAILHLEDLDGTVEILVFNEAYERYADILQVGFPAMICGTISRREDTPKIVATEIYHIEDVPKLFTKRIGIHIPANSVGSGSLDKVNDILRTHPGKIPVTICMVFASGEKVFIETGDDFMVDPQKALTEELEHILGEESVYVAVDPKACLKSPSEQSYRRTNFS